MEISDNKEDGSPLQVTRKTNQYYQRRNCATSGAGRGFPETNPSRAPPTDDLGNRPGSDVSLDGHPKIIGRSFTASMDHHNLRVSVPVHANSQIQEGFSGFNTNLNFTEMGTQKTKIQVVLSDNQKDHNPRTKSQVGSPTLRNGGHANNFLNPYTGTPHSEKLVPYNGVFATRKSQKQLRKPKKKLARAPSQPSHVQSYGQSYGISTDSRPGSVKRIKTDSQQLATYGTNETSETPDEIGSLTMNYSKFNILNQANTTKHQANQKRFSDLQIDSKETAEYTAERPLANFGKLVNIVLEDHNGEVQNPSGVFASLQSFGDVMNQDTPS
jgi:hypothetical protein